MSTTTVKAKAEVAVKAATDSNPLPAENPSTTGQKSRITPPEDVPRYEQMIGRKFVKKDGTTNGKIYIPKHITQFWVMGAEEMGNGDGSTPFIAAFYVEETSTNGEPEPPVTTMILGRPIKARPPVKDSYIACARFAAEYEETRE